MLTGSGFAASELVDLFAGSVDTAVVTTGAQGTFSYSGTIPAGAQPGTLWLTAVGRRSGAAAQASFLVRTDWVQRGFGTAHRGLNPYENTLTPSNVVGIDRAWTVATGDKVDSSPAVVNGIAYFGSNDHTPYAVSADTRNAIWSYATSAPVVSSPAVTPPRTSPWPSSGSSAKRLALARRSDATHPAARTAAIARSRGWAFAIARSGLP